VPRAGRHPGPRGHTLIAREDLPEISDLVIDFDEETRERRPVQKEAVVERLRGLGMTDAWRIVAGWPARGGALDEEHVDGVLLRSHLELQRLSEEFQQGARMARLLVPLLETLRAHGVPPPYRVVDVGCGPGYVVRWLAAHGTLGPDVVLTGADYNAPLVRAANRFAQAEHLACRFVVENAFQLDEPATVYLSTGVIHHVRGQGLPRFLAEQKGALAFIHCDIKPSWLAPIGSWVFHVARMREPLARHDGVLSAIRAHPAETLASAARAACPDHDVSVFDGRAELVPILRVMQALIGVRRDLAGAYRRALGSLAERLDGGDA
jgi:SAM-dependent methyltransferase